MRRFGLALGLLLTVGTLGRAEPVDFQRDVRPILSARCFKCHGPAAHEGGLRLDLRDKAIPKAIAPGKPATSRLIQRITTTDDDKRMPPADTGNPLTSAQVATLRAWIEQGAAYTPHWAYQPPHAAPLPAVQDAGWPRGGIDYFILARLEREGLHPSATADKVTLIRRVSLDLLGLLPTPDEVEAFVQDERANAYERLVDRLLASPHYGERQARHWLDVARYADSNGYTIDGPRTIWPYRDWVIAAFNRDLPFEEFTIEQLAGDLLPNATHEQRVATGFHRNTPFNEEGGTDPEQFRVERTLDRTNTTGAAWLGLTVGCAQCHDHKYDPFSQKEYYRLYAFFDSIDEPTLSLGTPEQAKQIKDLRAQLRNAFDKQDRTRARQLEEDLLRLEQVAPSTLVLSEPKQPRVTHVHLRGDFLNPGEVVEPGTFACLPPLVVNGRAANRLDLARWLVRPDHPLTARVFVNRAWQHLFGIGLVETENDFGVQGNPPSHPELLDWLAVEFMRNGWSVKQLHRLIVTSAAYRQAAIPRSALLMKDPSNRLLGRQNRVRLDAEIIRDAALGASGLLTRKLGGPGVYPPQPKEVFSFTQNSHSWIESQGAQRYRRGMYTYIWRQSQHPLLPTFDAPDAQTTCTRRNRSNTPLQALHLANDPAFVEMARALGERVVHEGPSDDAGRIACAFRLCLARPPEPAESARLLRYFHEQQRDQPTTAWTMVARVLLNLDEFITRE